MLSLLFCVKIQILIWTSVVRNKIRNNSQVGFHNCLEGDLPRMREFPTLQSLIYTFVRDDRTAGPDSFGMSRRIARSRWRTFNPQPYRRHFGGDSSRQPSTPDF